MIFSRTPQRLLVLTATALVILTQQAPAAEPKTYPNLKITGSLKMQATGDENADLGVGAEDFQDSESIEGKIRLKANLTDNLTFFNEDRGVLNYGEGGGEDPDTGEALGREDFLELRQLWLEYKEDSLSEKIGRQRFSEPSSLWWNRDFDAARIAYDKDDFKGFIAAGENLASYRTSGEDFQEQHEDIFRALAEGSWQWTDDQYFETRLAYQDDHSGMENAGTVVSSDNRDEEDANLTWAGMRMRGEAPASKITYRVDLMGVAGDAEQQQTVAGPGNNLTVTGSADRDVLGWAFDAGVNIPLPMDEKAVLLLDYAFGSGDDDTTGDTDHAFRQTGLDSNASAYGQTNSSIHNYGSVLRPDLSNLHIFTAGVTVPVLKASDIVALYHYYRLDEEATDLLTSGVDAPLNNSDKDLGHAVDIMFTVNLTKEAGLSYQHVREVDWRTTVGAFRAGEAYGTGEDEITARGRMELVIRF